MKTIGNILWFIFGGFISGLGWLLSGLILYDAAETQINK